MIVMLSVISLSTSMLSSSTFALRSDSAEVVRSIFAVAVFVFFFLPCLTGTLLSGKGHKKGVSDIECSNIPHATESFQSHVSQLFAFAWRYWCFNEKILHGSATKFFGFASNTKRAEELFAKGWLRSSSGNSSN